jgi:SHS2 domain-containing protein
MLFGIYTARDDAEYVGAGLTIEEVIEDLKGWLINEFIDTSRLQVFEGTPVKVTKTV